MTEKEIKRMGGRIRREKDNNDMTSSEREAWNYFNSLWARDRWGFPQGVLALFADRWESPPWWEIDKFIKKLVIKTDVFFGLSGLNTNRDGVFVARINPKLYCLGAEVDNSVNRGETMP